MKTYTLERYRNDGIVKQEWTAAKDKAARGNTQRRDIVELSKDSLKKLSFVANNSEVDFTHMVTLTYPANFPRDGQVYKAHLNAFLNHVRRKTGGSYLWFMEFQRRGAAHFHVMLRYEGQGLEYEGGNGGEVGSKLAIAWAGIVGESGGEREKHERWGLNCQRIKSANGAARYVAKYAAKADQKAVPEWLPSVGRFWGNSRDVTPRVRETVERIPLHEFPGERLYTITLEIEGENIEIVNPYRYQFRLGTGE